MENDFFQKAEYPYNLIFAAKGNSNVGFPATSRENVILGLEHVLSKLEKEEALFLRQRFAEGKSLEELCSDDFLPLEAIRQKEQKILRKLRVPSRWGFIQFGIEGYIKNRIGETRQTAYKQGFVDGYERGLQDKRQERIPKNVLDMPLETLELPVKAFIALTRQNYDRVGDIVNLSESQIIRIRNMGNTSIRAIAAALEKHGICHTKWDAVKY